MAEQQDKSQESEDQVAVDSVDQEPGDSVGDDSNATADPGVSQASIKYIGKWRGLVSTTNWEKGKIIAAWRQDLIDNDAPLVEYSDEAWSQLVGDVTPQHVGRLRRVHERFEKTWSSYEGLYWTHFLAALDWEDCELWLEGALQNHWSVSQMRRQRWETLGSIQADEPLESQIVSEEDADVDPMLGDGDLYIEDVENVAMASGPDNSGSSDSSGKATSKSDKKPSAADPADNSQDKFATGIAAEPLESLDDFPEDFVDAFEDFRHVILNHKKAGWDEISQEEVLQSLESLRLVVVGE